MRTLNIQTKKDCDLAIIGGGLVGLSFALLAAKECLMSAGMSKKCITVIEPRDLASVLEDMQSGLSGDALGNVINDARTTALSPNTVELYQYLGLWSALEVYATPITQVLVSDRGQWGKSHFGLEHNDQQPVGYVVSNRALMSCLMGALKDQKNVTFLSPVTVEKLVPFKDGMNIVLNNSDVLAADLAVVADGANSCLRQQLGIATEKIEYNQHALVTNISYKKPHKGRAFERFTCDGPLALLPLGGGLEASTSALVWTRPNTEIERTLAFDEATFLHELHKRFGYSLGEFTAVGPRHSFPLALTLAKEQVRSSCVLIGNALHSLHPVAGQGFNLAIRDCMQLASVLCDSVSFGKSAMPVGELDACLRLGDLKRLQVYERLQKADQKATVLISHHFNQLFSKKSMLAKSARTLGLIGIEMLGNAKHDFFSHMMGRGHAQPELLIRRNSISRKPRNYSQ